MKGYLGIVLLVMCIMMFFVGLGEDYSVAEQSISLDHVTRILTKNFTAAQANYELLLDTNLPRTTSRYVVTDIVFSTYAVNSIYVNDSATSGDKGYGPFRLGEHSNLIVQNIGMQLDAAAGLYVTTEASGDITVNYYIRN